LGKFCRHLAYFHPVLVIYIQKIWQPWLRIGLGSESNSPELMRKPFFQKQKTISDGQKYSKPGLPDRIFSDQKS
jgi:hypothetical protein